jgi:chromosome partitioning protein
MATFENASDFEKVVALLLERDGWQVKMPPANTKGYDIAAVKNNIPIAVQVKNYRTPVKVPQLEKFFDFLDLPIAAKFAGGLFVSASGYSRQALTYFEQTQSSKVRLGEIHNGRLKIFGGELVPPSPASQEPTYLGVFTCKGGVGKTTVSAHLAGAMALSGYDVALIDLDPQRNLTTLLGKGLTLPGSNKKLGNTISVYDIEQLDNGKPPNDVKMVVCDCSPVFEMNDEELIKKFTYCIIPTTLNPLGLNKNGHVIKSTVEEIRRVNKDAYIFVLINNYQADETKRSQVLKDQYHRYFAEMSEEDEKFEFIDPDEVVIRNSKQLFYWGYHIYDNGRPELAFNSIGGRCLPKADFLNLLNYLEDHSDIEEHRN